MLLPDFKEIPVEADTPQKTPSQLWLGPSRQPFSLFLLRGRKPVAQITTSKLKIYIFETPSRTIIKV